MDPTVLETILSKLDIPNASCPDQARKMLMTMPEQQRLAFISDAMSKSKLGPFDIILLQCQERRHLPLARIRDSVNGKKKYVNHVCNGCGMGADDVDVDEDDVVSSHKCMITCTTCSAVFYCNKTCQARDWNGKGVGPTQPRSHKEMCDELDQARNEFSLDKNKGEALRKVAFSTWADQHHESGAFFLYEYLARRGLLGQANVGFWAMPNYSGGPYMEAGGKDPSGFMNGQMLLGPSFPSLQVGWTENLKESEFPSSDPPESLPPKEGIRNWEEYMRYRNLSTTSIAPLLLTHVLTVYQMLVHDLGFLAATTTTTTTTTTTNGKKKKKKRSVYLLGVEVELNQIPLFAELAFLLPDIDLTIRMVSPAAKGLCKEAQKYPTSIIAQNKDNIVLDFRAPADAGGGRLRIQLVEESEYFADLTDSKSMSADAVLGLNAGLATYSAWIPTMRKILVCGMPFAFSDQTKLGLRQAQVLWFPEEVVGDFQSITVPLLEIKLNPFHGVVSRDVAAIHVPNLSNGYILVSK
jgi:hypothetical protein